VPICSFESGDCSMRSRSGRSGQVEFFGNGDEATQMAKFH
jgi:hypothetical protein